MQIRAIFIIFGGGVAKRRSTKICWKNMLIDLKF